MKNDNVPKLSPTELRRTAEERLKENQSGTTAAATETDPQRLLHELQVHQIELEMQNAELRQAHDDRETLLEQYTDLYDFAPVGYFTILRNGKIAKLNLTGAALLGIDRSKLNGYFFKKFIAAESRPHFDDFHNNVFSSLAKQTCEVSILKEDGALKQLQLEAVITTSGEDYHLVALDITERKQAEGQHLELETQLRQKHKMEAVGYMAGGMAHNFNNNLGIILGNVELSLMKQPPGSEVIPLLKNAKIAVDRSRDLVKKIITYSRQGSQQNNPMPLTTITNETISLLKSTLPATVSLQTTYGSDCDTTFIDADPSQIQEVLINLCNNAAQAMNETGELSIQLEPVELTQREIPAQYDCLPGLYARLSVQDSGSGISPEILDKIFDPFFTTKEEYEGAGMGLATVQGIVAQHGGVIKVNSIPDQGTVFNLYFPIIEQTHIDQPTAEDTTVPRGTERILFVDDDEMLASLGEKLLTQMGYQVVVMNESTEALKMFAVNAEHFDLVITDQTMPQLSGKDLIEELKKIRPDIPTILCTGYSSKIDKDHAKELGINAFMMKPLGLIPLAQTVRRVLDGVEVG